MKRLIFAFLALMLAPLAPAHATSLYRLSGSFVVGLQCNLADASSFLCPGVTLLDSAGAAFGTVGNPINVTSAGTSGLVEGTQARAAAITAKPVLMGCRGSAVAPSAVSSGQLVEPYCSTIGTLITTVSDTSGNVAATSNPSTGTGIQRGLATFSQTMFAQGNSTTQEEAFICPNSVAINVTAGNTTEIVALTAAQAIRVCSISVGISASGTVGVVYGTGTNCATGTATLVTDMNLTSGNLWAVSSGGGTALFRGASANAICVKAVTGNVVGYLSYAKF